MGDGSLVHRKAEPSISSKLKGQRMGLCVINQHPQALACGLWHGRLAEVPANWGDPVPDAAPTVPATESGTRAQSVC